jgi:hypothetical protein
MQAVTRRAMLAGDSIIAIAARRAAELMPADGSDLSDEAQDELFGLVDAAVHLKPTTVSDVSFLLLAAHNQVGLIQGFNGDGKQEAAAIATILTNVLKFLLRGGHVQLDPKLAAHFWREAAIAEPLHPGGSDTNPKPVRRRSRGSRLVAPA